MQGSPHVQVDDSRKNGGTGLDCQLRHSISEAALATKKRDGESLAAKVSVWSHVNNTLCLQYSFGLYQHASVNEGIGVGHRATEGTDSADRADALLEEIGLDHRAKWTVDEHTEDSRVVLPCHAEVVKAVCTHNAMQRKTRRGYLEQNVEEPQMLPSCGHQYTADDNIGCNIPKISRFQKLMNQVDFGLEESLLEPGDATKPGADASTQAIEGFAHSDTNGHAKQCAPELGELPETKGLGHGSKLVVERWWS